MFRRFRTANLARRPKLAARRGSILRLEMLENRLALATLTVTSPGDSGPGTLRETIGLAASGDTIDFTHSLSGSTIKLNTELAINKSLTIEGLGADKLAISGDDVTRVFNILGGTTTIEDLTIAHGRSTGELPSSLVGTYTGTGTGAGGGGGILNQPGANLTLENDVLRDNEAVGAVGFTVAGGGLLNLGTAAIVGCQFTNNESTGGGAFDNLGGSAGGAIDNFGGPTGGARLVATNTTFSGNTAESAGDNFYYGLGGAVEDNAGLNGYTSSLAEPSSATFNNCAFLNNLATGGTGAIANGGALVMEGDGASLTLVGCTVSGNRALGGNGGDSATTGDSEAVGGGVLGVAGTLTITNSVIVNNQAIGGSHVTISATDPSGGPYGGGAFGGGIAGNVLNISNSLVANNTAQGGTVATGPGGMAAGGGITSSPSGIMVMTNCVVSGNRAIGGQGGPGTNAQLNGLQTGFSFGGGIDISNGASSATITGSQIVGNAAIGGAGGTGNNGGNGYGGGIGVGWAALFGNSDGSHLTLVDSSVAHNLAQGGMGGAGGNGGSGLGGALFVSSSGNASITASDLESNAAIGGEEGAGGQDGQGHGGGICDQVGSSLSYDAATRVKHNVASTSGDNFYTF
jgi:hypothetical protein